MNYGGDGKSVPYFRRGNKSAIVPSMTPEEKSLLERTYKLAEENNAMLHSIKRSARISNVMKIVYWVIIIGSGFGAFYFFQSYIDSLRGAFGQDTAGLGAARSNTGLLNELLGK